MERTNETATDQPLEELDESETCNWPDDFDIGNPVG